MSANRKHPVKGMVPAGIELLQLLATSPDQTVGIQAACNALGVDEERLTRLVDMLSQVSDGASGTRLAIEADGDSVRLYGETGRLQPIRLNVTDAAVLEHVLGELDLDEGLRQRAETALLPRGYHAGPHGRAMGDMTEYGPFYQPLKEAIQDGARCVISYRSTGAAHAAPRTIDPHRIFVENGAAYLGAWDTERDAQRIYRLDRIGKLSVTDESVSLHEFEVAPISDGLQRRAPKAVVSFAGLDLARSVGWAGLDETTIATSDHEGWVTAEVSVGSETWLFNQILSLGGAARIDEPADLRRRLVEYAKRLSERA